MESNARRIESILTDSTGRTWLATNTFLFYIDEETDELMRMRGFYRALQMRPSPVSEIFEDPYGRLWFGIWGRGLASYDPESEALQWEYQGLSDLRGDLIHDMDYVAGSGHWAATRYSGLLHRPSGESEWREYSSMGDTSLNLPSDTILCLYTDYDGSLWLCTELGLVHVNTDTLSTRAWSRVDGLPSDRILALHDDLDGHLWIATGQGLARLDESSGRIISFGLNDGLPAMEFQRRAITRDSFGNIYAGTVRGAVRFEPSGLNIETRAPQVALSRVWADDIEITPRLRGANVEIHLPRDHRNLVIQYSVLDFHEPERNSARYRLVGLHNEWSQLTDSRQLIFPRLAPGEYSLEVEGWNSHGIAAEPILRVPVVVAHPWWMNWWVVILAFAGLAAFIVLIVNLRFQSLARLNRRLDQQVQERTQELEALNAQLREQSQTDYLTSLPNRRGFTEKFAWLRAQMERYQRPFSLVLFDVDHFKRLNDVHGHDAGDQVLIALSELLRQRLREQDIPGRWGGEEFAILLPETNAEQACMVCENLRKHLERMVVEYNTESLQVTATFGIYAGEQRGTSIEHWMSNADAALYHGKQQGRNCSVIFSPSLITN